MSWKSTLLRPIARFIAWRVKNKAANAIEAQNAIFEQLIATAKHTQFGKDHDFEGISSYEDFKNRVPVRDYEAARSYFDAVKAGGSDILWPGRPAYFAKTSGTTSGAKYIPITKDSLPNHFSSARNALFCYAAETGHYSWIDGKQIFLSGSPEMDDTNGIPTGRLSGISNHLIPGWLKQSQLPSYPTNCIEDWEDKVEHIVDETIDADLRLISGIPPWVQMYYERLLERTNKETVIKALPKLEVFVYGGVNFEPYRASLERLVGKRLPSVEVYPASEGFIAYQDSQVEEGLLLNTSSGIFFEFIPATEVFEENPTRISLKDVQIGVNYAIILNTNAGLWSYNIGDTVEFVNLNPFRIKVTGRIKHFISAFGEHVIGKEVETAMNEVAARHQVEVVEFTVAPQVNPTEGLPYHEWLIEFAKAPEDLAAFAAALDEKMVLQNAYYADLIEGKILRPLIVRSLAADSFRNYMRSQGKLGGQNKVPRLADNRKIADAILTK